MPEEFAAPQPRPLLTVEQQIAHMKAKGITFDLCTEADAAAYLRDANNYLRTASYRQLFPVNEQGAHTGLFIHLDFAYLIELSSVDRMLREAFRPLTIDVEHFAKMRLLSRIESKREDGYAIVSDFLAERPRAGRVLSSRAETGERHDTYTGDLIAHYLDAMPAWALLEVVDFGTFTDFWLFCAERWGDEEMRQQHYILKSVKALRNACAHNNLLVHGLDARNAPADYPTNSLLSDSLNAHGMKNSRTRRSKLGNLRVAQMAAALWSLDEFCARPSTRSRNAERLDAVRRCVEAARFSQSPSVGANKSILSFFSFIWKLVDIWATPQA